MAGKRKTSGLVVYNLLLKEVSRINKGLKENRKLSLPERRALISKKIYPEYKGLRKDQVRFWPLRELIYRKLKNVRARQGCDVRAIPKEEYTGVPYFALDDQIRNIYPKCVYLRAYAGKYGITNIFSTREYDYERSGIAEITRALNEEMQRSPKRRDSTIAPVYNGGVQLRPKKKNDGAPSSYYLELILEINDRPVAKLQQIDIPSSISSKKVSKKIQKEREAIAAKIAEVKFKRTEIKQILSLFLKNARIHKLVMRSVRDKKEKKKTN